MPNADHGTGEENRGPGSQQGPDDNQGPGNSDTGDNQGRGHQPKFHIQIDRAKYEVTQSVMTGAELRAVPPGGIPTDRDLFEVVPGGPDKKIGDNDQVEIRNGKRFFTAPGQINPGRTLK